ncbi:MAG TPA: hypothetical protein VGG49_10740 [Steroidobacteraceae bacterium]|jgi:xanthine dehydrogenase accessory factor
MSMPPGAILVMGCGDIGSAVAHRLFKRGASVVLCDLARPAHARRGMAFTDALFEGTAVLDGVIGRFAADLRAMFDLWQAANCVPVVTLREDTLLEAVQFDAVIEATMRRDRLPPDIRSCARFTIGLGPGYLPGANCHVAVETQWGAALGEVVRDHATAPRGGGPKLLEGVGRERFVPAPVGGPWSTTASIGQRVQAGQFVGVIGQTPICAPLSGCLRGLTHDGVEVRCGQRIVEVDPRQPAQIFGLGERPAAVADGVCRALGVQPTH